MVVDQRELTSTTSQLSCDYITTSCFNSLTVGTNSDNIKLYAFRQTSPPVKRSNQCFGFGEHYSYTFDFVTKEFYSCRHLISIIQRFISFSSVRITTGWPVRFRKEGFSSRTIRSCDPTISIKIKVSYDTDYSCQQGTQQRSQKLEQALLHGQHRRGWCPFVFLKKFENSIQNYADNFALLFRMN